MKSYIVGNDGGLKVVRKVVGVVIGAYIFECSKWLDGDLFIGLNYK